MAPHNVKILLLLQMLSDIGHYNQKLLGMTQNTFMVNSNSALNRQSQKCAFLLVLSQFSENLS